MRKRVALVLALVTMLAMVTAPVALADENEAGWWGNIAGYPYPGSPVCLTALDGSMIQNCHLQDPLRPYEPVKFDGVPPKMYMVTSGPAKAFVFANPGSDNWINWAWMIPMGWNHGMSTPPMPAYNMWHPGGGMSYGPPTVSVNVEQSLTSTGSGKGEQSVTVKSPIATNVKVTQSINVKPAVVPSTKGGSKVVCFTYTIKLGDSLSKIAVKFHDTVWGLVSRNHIANASKIFAGQKITVCDP